MKRFILCGLFLLLSLGYCVNAKAKVTDTDMMKKVGCSKENFKKIKAIVSVMKEDGYSDEAIAGALGNSWQETGWNPLSEGMWGLCDTYSNWKSSKYYKSCTHIKNTYNGNGAGGTHNYDWCSEGVCTTAFAMATLANDIKTYKKNLSNYNAMMKKHYDEAKKFEHKGAKNPPQKIDAFTDLDGFKKSKDVSSTAICWMAVMERCKGIYLYCMGGWHSGSYDWQESWWQPERASGVSGYGAIKNLFIHEHGQEGAGRPYRAGIVYEWITGSKFEPSSGGTNSGSTGKDADGNIEADKKLQAQLATTLASNGYWSEKQLSSFCKLQELNLSDYIDNATIGALGQEDLSGLSNWKKNVGDNSLGSKFVKFLRKVVQMIGVLFIVWSFLVYFGFWFDRTNVFIDIDVVGILTFGRLHTSMEDRDSNYGSRSYDKKVLLAHRHVLMISLSGIVFGLLIVSGTMFTIINLLINLVFNIIGA